jgi:nicotinamidase-related amidase
MAAPKTPWRRTVARSGEGAASARRVVVDESCGVIIDVQEFFLSQIDKHARSRIKSNTKSFARLLGYFNIPILVTLERSIDDKGALPKEIARHLKDGAQVFQKHFFDLTKEDAIREHLARLGKKQMIVAGCETDVCVLQSCLGLLDLGYQVFVIEELLFSGSPGVEAAIARMQSEGAVFMSYKTLFYELLETVEGSRRSDEVLEAFGPFPEDLPDRAGG